MSLNRLVIYLFNWLLTLPITLTSLSYYYLFRWDNNCLSKYPLLSLIISIRLYYFNSISLFNIKYLNMFLLMNERSNNSNWLNNYYLLCIFTNISIFSVNSSESRWFWYNSWIAVTTLFYSSKAYFMICWYWLLWI